MNTLKVVFLKRLVNCWCFASFFVFSRCCFWFTTSEIYRRQHPAAEEEF